MSILVFRKIFKNVDFSQYFRKMSILVKSFEKISIFGKSWKNINFSKNFEKFQLQSLIWKISISYKLKKMSKILIFVKIFASKFSNISIIVQLFENPDFSENFRKIAILVNFFFNFDFS